MTDEKKDIQTLPEGGLHAGENPGSGPTMAAHDYVPPHGADAVEPDSPPMRLLTITIAILAIVVIGTGIALGEWLSMAAREEAERKQGDGNPELIKLRQAGAERLSSYGYDEDKKLHRIPLEQAMSFLAQNPDRVATTALWSDLKSLDVPEPVKGQPGQGQGQAN